MRTTKLLAAAGLAAAGLLLVTPTAATAKTAPVPVTISNQLAAPFNLDLTRGIHVADGGLNLVGRVRADGSVKVLAADQPGASGIAMSSNGKYLAYTTTVTDAATFENTASGLHIWGPRGKRVFADTFAYEGAHNPDSVNTYGVVGPVSDCVKQALGAAQIPVSYTGEKDSHAYSVASWGRQWVVADAGSNVLWKINNRGDIKTLAVLPPQPVTITADMAGALGLPACVAGITYAFEAVPTDVEVGHDGYLYVTTLPGGPESPALGARGKLWRVNPWTGKSRVIASGFLGATNLAIGTHGKIYVAEFFGGKISVVQHGVKSDYATLPGVVAVETDKCGNLYAGTLGSDDGSAPGTIVRVRRGHVSTTATLAR